MNDSYRREVNSLLNYSDEIIFESNNDNKEKQKHGKNRNNDHRDDSKKDKKNNHQWNNPVLKIINNESYYDKNQIYKALVKQDGLYKMIKDLKDWSNNPKEKKPNYIGFILRDIVVAAALPDAINTLLDENKYDLNKKDFDQLMNEILLVIRNSNDDPELLNKYSKESIEAMREAYTSILYKFNKKKLKKFKEIDINESMAKKIVILTAGSPKNTIYQLLKFLYRNSDDLRLSEKVFIKILKICYGKDSMPEVIKCIMNEKINPLSKNDLCKSESEIWVLVDQVMRDQLENMSKKDLEKTILAYIKERKMAKKRGDNIKRRFGDRRSIHPEDYPKITKVIENLEKEDFSIIEYLR